VECWFKVGGGASVADCSRAQVLQALHLLGNSWRPHNTSPRSPPSGGLRPPCSGLRPEHRPAATSRRSLQGSYRVLAITVLLDVKDILRSEHFNGGGSAEVSRGVFGDRGFQRNPLIKTTQDRGHMIDQTTAFPKLKAHASPHTPDRHQIWNISVRHPATTYAHSNLRVMLI